jgi:hypothetical protein
MMRKALFALAVFLAGAATCEANPLARLLGRDRDRVNIRVRARFAPRDRRPFYRPVYEPTFAPRSSRFSLDLRLRSGRSGCVGPWCP